MFVGDNAICLMCNPPNAQADEYRSSAAKLQKVHEFFSGMVDKVSKEDIAEYESHLAEQKRIIDILED